MDRQPRLKWAIHSNQINSNLTLSMDRNKWLRVNMTIILKEVWAKSIKIFLKLGLITN